MRCLQAESVGGDFYNLLNLHGDRIGVMLGDVSSHGFSAALIMALAMAASGIHAETAETPSEVLRRLEASLADELARTEMFMTLFYGVIDPAAGRLAYANAGHPHAFLVTGTEASRDGKQADSQQQEAQGLWLLGLRREARSIHLRRHPRVFLAMTGLHVHEFDELVAALSEAATWQRQGDFVSFTGTRSLRFRLNTN